MERAQSISTKELLEHAHKAAVEVLGGGNPLLKDVEFGVFHDIGIVGVRWRDEVLKQVEPKELEVLSGKITELMAPKYQAASLAALSKGGVTAGYFPPDPQIREMLR